MSEEKITTDYTEQEVFYCSISSLLVDFGLNTRGVIDWDGIPPFAAEIAADGLRTPLQVIEVGKATGFETDNGTGVRSLELGVKNLVKDLAFPELDTKGPYYSLVAGHRRFLACLLNSANDPSYQIPITIIGKEKSYNDISAERRAVAGLAENLQREEPHPAAVSHWLAYVKRQVNPETGKKWTLQQMSTKFGKSVSHIGLMVSIQQKVDSRILRHWVSADMPFRYLQSLSVLERDGQLQSFAREYPAFAKMEGIERAKTNKSKGEGKGEGKGENLSPKALAYRFIGHALENGAWGRTAGAKATKELLELVVKEDYEAIMVLISKYCEMEEEEEEEEEEEGTGIEEE